MSLDKAEYWKRRNNVEEIKDDKGKVLETIPKPLRGQDELPAPKPARWTKEDHEAGKCSKDDIGKERFSGVEMQMTRKGLIAYPRRERRRKIIDHDYTRPNVSYRMNRDTVPFQGHRNQTPLSKTEAKELPKWRARLPKEWEHPKLSHSPTETNRQRHLAGQERRKAIRAAAAAQRLEEAKK